MKDFSGVFTALITPFKAGSIDSNSLRRLIRQQLDAGINGFVVCGTTAESPTLSNEEKRELFAFVKAEVAGQVPLIMGTGTNSTADTIEATRDAEKWGADAALVVVPYYNKPPQRGLFQHYQKVAECSSLPVILYNVPSRTITTLELQTIKELSRLPNVVGIKEATGNIEFGSEIARACGPNFLLTSGDDATYIDLIRVGGKGIIAVGSHVAPKKFVEWCVRARRGDASAREDFLRYAEAIAGLYVEPNPIPVKMALYLMGVIESPELRLPLVSLTEPHTAELKRRLKAVELLQ